MAVVVAGINLGCHGMSLAKGLPEADGSQGKTSSSSVDRSQLLVSDNHASSNSSPQVTHALQLQLSTTATQLSQETEPQLWEEDPILLDLFADSQQPTLIAATQELMPLYLHSVRQVDGNNRGMSIAIGGETESSQSLNQFLENFSDSHRCHVAWQFPDLQLSSAIEFQHQVAIERQRLPGSSLCQSMDATEDLRLTSRLKFLPLQVGNFAFLDLGSVNYSLFQAASGEVSTSLGVSPSLTMTPVEGFRLELHYDLDLKSEHLIPEDWSAAIRTHRGGAALNIELPQILGNRIELFVDGEYDWLTEGWTPGTVKVAWDIVPLGIRSLAATKYDLPAFELQPIAFVFEHELPWDIRWGFRTHYYPNQGEFAPLDFTIDHDLPIMEWLLSKQPIAKQVNLHYGLQAQQTDLQDGVEYALGVGIAVGQRDVGRWNFRMDLDGTYIERLETTYDRQDWQMQVSVEPHPSNYLIEGRITFSPGN